MPTISPTLRPTVQPTAILTATPTAVPVATTPIEVEVVIPHRPDVESIKEEEPASGLRPLKQWVPEEKTIDVLPSEQESVESQINPEHWPVLRTLIQEVRNAPRLALPRQSDTQGTEVLQARMQAIYALAARGRKQQARREFRALADSFSQQSIAPEALYEAAMLEKSNLNQQLIELYGLVNRYPGTVWTERAIKSIAETHLLRGDHLEALDALEAYEILRAEGHNQPAFRMQKVYCFMALLYYDRALSELQLIEIERPTYRNSETILRLRAECLVATEKYESASVALRTLLREYPNHNMAPHALFLLGMSLEEMGRFQTAREIYQQIIRSYPPNRSDTPFETQAAASRLIQLEKPLFSKAKKMGKIHFQQRPIAPDQAPEPLLLPTEDSSSKQILVP